MGKVDEKTFVSFLGKGVRIVRLNPGDDYLFTHQGV